MAPALQEYPDGIEPRIRVASIYQCAMRIGIAKYSQVQRTVVVERYLIHDSCIDATLRMGAITVGRR